MKFTKLLVGAASVAAVAGIAAPAAAQTYPAPTYPQSYPYPGQTYPAPGYPAQTYPGYPVQSYPGYPAQTYPGYPAPGYPQQGYAYPQQQQQGGIAGIIGQLLGNRYQTNDRTAITQCAAAAQAKAAAQYRPTGEQGYYGQQGYGQQGYGQYNGYGTARVTGITNVERRNNGLRVSGTMASGMGLGYANQGYNRGYNPAYANVSDLTFRCNVDYRGAVSNIRINRATTAYRR